MERFEFEDLLDDELIFTEFEADNKEELIFKLSKIIEEKGYVTKYYANDVLQREKKYPTALPTEVMSVAIPHAESSDNVMTPSIVIAKLKDPISFIEMGSFDQKVDVNIVFLLAVKGSKTQLKLLPKLISIFSNKEEMKKIQQANNSKQIFQLIKDAMQA